MSQYIIFSDILSMYPDISDSLNSLLSTINSFIIPFKTENYFD